LLVAAKKESVSEFTNLLKLSGFDPFVVDVDFFALSNSFEATYGFGDERVALLDIGANKILEHTPVPLAYAKSMLEFAERNNVAIAVYAEEMFWRPAGSHVYMQDMIGPGWREIPSLLDALATGAPTFIRFLGAPAVEAMQREFGDLPLTYLHETWKDFVECVVLSRDASKKNALMRLCADFGIHSDAVLAIGDSRNDVPMLRWAGTGVAMANAADEVRQSVRYVTGDNAADGVAQAIERFCFAAEKKSA